MLDLSEVLADQREIDEAFKMGAQDIIGDTSELEEELNALVVAEEEALIKQLNDLKVVSPTTSPVASKIRAPVDEYSSEEGKEKPLPEKKPVLV